VLKPVLQNEWTWLSLVAGLLLAALLHPTLTLPRAGFDGMIVFDITQSMDVEDTKLAGAETSRLEFAKRAVIQALPDMPCGARVGVGVFTEYRTVHLLQPVEVCASLTELQGVVRAINGRIGWAGNSEVAKGLFWALRMASNAADTPASRPAVVFITDGHEAPPLNANNRLIYPGKAGAVRGTVLGVGGDAQSPIPKHAPDGKPLGLWDAGEVAQVNPYAKNYLDDGTHDSNKKDGSDGAVSTQRSAASDLQATPGTEHLSSVRERYLKLLARETGLAYARARLPDEILAALTAPALSVRHQQPTDIAPALAGLALLVWCLRYGILFSRRKA
jgi:mxaL protein